MKILTTGGAGFIGSHVVDAYIKAGHKVAVVDNLSTGSRKNLNPRAKFYKADIRDRAAVDRVMKQERPEIVNHHAAIAEVVRSLHNPLPTLQTNILGMANVLSAFGKYGRGRNKKFIFSSTGGAMYGKPKRLPAGEEEKIVTLSPMASQNTLEKKQSDSTRGTSALTISFSATQTSTGRAKIQKARQASSPSSAAS